MNGTTIKSLAWFVALGMIGCSQNAAEWDAKKIESWIEKEWNMDFVQVVQEGDRNYSGSGFDKEGVKSRFVIEQDADSKFLRCSRIDEQGRADGKAIRKY